MKYAILLSIVFVFLVTFSENATAAARIRALEISVCYAYYRGNRIPEHLCKIAPVQQELASLRAWLGVLEAIPSMQSAFVSAQKASELIHFTSLDYWAAPWSLCRQCRPAPRPAFECDRALDEPIQYHHIMYVHFVSCIEINGRIT